MKAALVREIGSFGIVDVDVPQPGPGEVLVEVAVAGLCRTDLKIIEKGHRDLVLPRIPAEEVVGTVCRLGEGVAATFMGKRVYVYPGTRCGTCRECRRGAGNLCRDMQIMGFHRDGGFAEYVVAPAGNLIDIPAATSFETAIFTEPLSCCLNALELTRVGPEETIIIWGGGPAGTLLARASHALGARPLVIEPDTRRQALLQAIMRRKNNFTFSGTY